MNIVLGRVQQKSSYRRPNHRTPSEVFHCSELKELDDWRKVQAAERTIAGDEYIDSGMIVTNPKGGYVEPRTFKDYYEQILAQSGLRHFTFHALRHTFASRAMEQGMDPKTLSVILGHYSVAFTLDTYSHVLTDHKVKEMGLMEELFQTSVDGTPRTYTIIITPQDDGTLYFTAPDFPAVFFISSDLQGEYST